jgi:hypothetical protein
MNFYEAVLAILNLYAHVWPGVRHGDPGLHVRGKRPCIRQADWVSGYLLFATDSRPDPTLNAWRLGATYTRDCRPLASTENDSRSEIRPLNLLTMGSALNRHCGPDDAFRDPNLLFPGNKVFVRPNQHVHKATCGTSPISGTPVLCLSATTPSGRKVSNQQEVANLILPLSRQPSAQTELNAFNLNVRSCALLLTRL